jgi:hypothetical protein
MNIHFTDETLFFQLMDSALAKIEVGSKMYKIENEKSDTDILVIYAESKENENSFVWSHHQLQYKKDNVDYVFTTLTQFVQNLLKGDQTILFEAVNSCILENTDLKWLYKLSYNYDLFVNYSMIRSYFGFAKRDLKQLRKYDSSNYYSDAFRKKLSHIYRSIHIGTLYYDIVIGSGVSFSSRMNSIYTTSLNIKNGDHEIFNLRVKSEVVIADVSKIENFVNDLEKTLHTCRENLNTQFENGTIHRYAKPNMLLLLDDHLKEYMKSESYKFKQRNVIDYGLIYYEALEKDITYNQKDG